jgi:hypothetical protein
VLPFLKKRAAEIKPIDLIWIMPAQGRQAAIPRLFLAMIMGASPGRAR